MAEKEEKPLTPKQEAFARAYVETGSQAEAYKAAYNCENMSAPAIGVEACRLLARPKVALKVVELQAEARERTMVTLESMTEEFNENRDVAKELQQASAMNAASVAKAKMYGLMVEKVDANVKAEFKVVLSQEADDL